MLDEAPAAYRRAANMRGELSTLDEPALWHLQRGQAATGLKVARRAHEMAIAVHGRKATAQTAATVAKAYLALGEAETAAGWYERCLSIAHATYPFAEARALAGLAAARLEGGDAQAARGLAEQAAAIASACGFRRLAARARTVLAACGAQVLIG
ncbi:hypothetical protein WBK31_15620 [Nonomuraea sp. N2-4H]|uniref:hypothetical protein n=1 Tax=Nonomuraea sp. N2-4H TaxID=3128898 RepID=UPI00324A322D